MARKVKATPVAVPAPAAMAVVVPTTAATPAKRGESTISTPVAQVWAIAHNMCVVARNEGKPVPARKAIMWAVTNAGVTFYTARTQVQAYLKASKGGTETPVKLPRHVTLEG
jgi:hypothetical protein